MPAEIDHIVIGCAGLDEGVAAMRKALGAPPVHFGAHSQMGTHNALWSLGNCYLELISIDPDAAPPGRARWFGLDGTATQARLHNGRALLTWVARVSDFSQATAQFGPVMSLTRDALRWQLTVPDDGEMPMEGCLPALIKWPDGSPTPSQTLSDSGLRLRSLHLPSLPALRAALPDFNTDQPIRFGSKRGIKVVIERADGARVEWDQQTAY